MILYQPMDVDDFSGGITDYYVGAPLNRYQKADNLVLVKYDRKARLFTRPGSGIYDPSAYQVPSASRVGTLKNFGTTLLTHSARKIYYVSAGAWTELSGPTGNALLPAGVTVNNYLSLAEWNNHLFGVSDAFTKPFKIYKDNTDTLRLRTAGLPKHATVPTVTPTANTGKNYIYRFTRRYTYQVGTLTFVDESSYVELFVSNSDNPGTNQNNVAAIPALANGAGDNYDTAASDFVTVIYRTVNNGDAFYQVGTVQNNTATFTDNVSDAALENNASMYTEGGVVENDAPPLCKVMHINQQRGYYAHTKEGTEIHANRLYQSIDGDPDSVPARFFVDIDDEIVGVSSVKDTTILLCKKSTWRVDGVFDIQGRGGMVAQKISDTSSCVSAQSAVQTLEGVFWCGEDSFYFTDAFKVLKLNRGWDQTHANIVQSSPAERKKRIQGKYDPRTRRIYWAVSDELSATDNDSVYVLDLNWPSFLDGVSDGAFTSMSGGDSFAPTALEFVDGNMLRGDKRGYIFKHFSSLYTDPKIDTFSIPSTWITQTIRYDYRGASTNFGSNFKRKFTPRISVVCENETNLSLQVVSNSDKNRIVGSCSPIRFRANLTWGDPDVYWGDADVIWNYDGLIDQYRRFPGKSLRCSYKQIYLQNAFVAIVSSDLIGSVVVNAVSKLATLVNSAQYDWPSQAVDYYLAFSNDGYVREYLVTARSSDVLTFADTQGVAPTGTLSWVLRGYPKGEIMNLVSYTIHYSSFGDSQTQFTTESTGEVGST